MTADVKIHNQQVIIDKIKRTMSPLNLNCLSSEREGSELTPSETTSSNSTQYTNSTHAPADSLSSCSVTNVFLTSPASNLMKYEIAHGSSTPFVVSENRCIKPKLPQPRVESKESLESIDSVSDCARNETKENQEAETDHTRRQQLQQECIHLREKILRIRKARLQLHEQTNAVQQHCEVWLSRLNKADTDNALALSSYKAIINRLESATHSLDVARRLNVTNDCFHIWHRGHFGTINGLRLGNLAPRTPVSATEPSGSADKAKSNAGVGDFDFASLFSGSIFDTSLGMTNGNGSNTLGKINGYDSYKVSWPETNAALGMAALLLFSLEQKPNSGIKFTTHEIVPMGSYTKIGVRQPDGKPSLMYNLFYYDDSFQFFAKRNFNIALTGLFRCMADAADSALRLDKTIVMPHPVKTGYRGDITIGDLPVTFAGDGEKWTQAMKYFLIDLKWLVAFTTRHVDR